MKADPLGSRLLIGETPDEQAQILRDYRTAVLDVRDKHVFKDHDARGVMLNNLVGPACVYITTLNLAAWGGDKAPLLGRILDIQDLNYVQTGLDDLFRAAKLYFLVDSQFQIENCLRRLLRILEPANKSHSFYKIGGHVLKACGLADGGSRFQRLYCPAVIRNSLHNNGVHNQDSINYEIDGVKYEFIDGKRVMCAKLEYVVHALRQSLSVVEEIVSSAASRRIDWIEDPFAKQRADGKCLPA